MSRIQQTMGQEHFADRLAHQSAMLSALSLSSGSMDDATLADFIDACVTLSVDLRDIFDGLFDAPDSTEPVFVRELADLRKAAAHTGEEVLKTEHSHNIEKLQTAELDECRAGLKEAQDGFAKLLELFRAIESGAGRKAEAIRLAIEGQEEARRLESVMGGRISA
ncbi:hypothetical protein ETQ85_00590 [Zoogloea oleivorans]|uniref:Uncharacterized protein n=1 Tax=Zoogloea oleivorans TaxID=1552750 RepID=A0A6C2D6F7_9RHOO|nr:hypothetical protein [Zoogloea oleivorans]TYC62090.1 hypothetical protein ETQ85_00590 [Zoogloea oleivorans]